MRRPMKMELHADEFTCDKNSAEDLVFYVDDALTIDDIAYKMKTRICEVTKGDQIFISFSGRVYKLGEKHDFWDGAIISRIYYEPRKWWQFWKQKKILGYIVDFIE